MRFPVTRLIVCLTIAFSMVVPVMSFGQSAEELEQSRRVQADRTLAAGGDAAAMGRLGWAYYRGTGVERDAFTALDWFTKGSAGGDNAAMHGIGVFFQERGNPADYHYAVKSFSKLAMADYTPGMCSLAECLIAGTGCTVDLEKAFGWYERAASLGHSGAMYQVGVAKQAGRGTARDPKGAYAAFDQAASHNNPDGLHARGACRQYGVGDHDRPRRCPGRLRGRHAIPTRAIDARTRTALP